MNGKDLVSPPSYEFSSPLLFDDGSNGNEEDSVLKRNLNTKDAALAMPRSVYDIGNDSIPQDHTELDSTVDYTRKTSENGMSDVMSTMHINQMQFENTVDYINKESSQVIPTKTSGFSHHESTTHPSALKCMHNKHDVPQPMPYIQKSSDAYYSKTDLSQFSVKHTDEAWGNAVSEQVGAPFTMHPGIDVPTLSLFSMSLDMSEMHMRKNSVLSSSSEKPMSTSLLDSSVLPNTSIEVFSGSMKWTNKMPSCCDSGQSFSKEFNYFEVPPHNKDPVDQDLIHKDPEVTNQAGDENVNTCHVLEGCTNESVSYPPDNISPTKQMKDDINKNNMCPLPVKDQESNLPVLHIEEPHLTEQGNGSYVDKDCKSSSRSQSVSIDSKDLDNTSGHNGEDTFLIESPQTDAKAYTSTPLPESKNMTFYVPVLDDNGLAEKPVKADLRDVNNGNHLETLGSGAGTATTKHIYRKPTPVISVAKAKKSEVVNFPKPNFKNVKAKVLTRAALITTKDCASYASKPSPRSPQSTASSPLASPRAPASAIKTASRKSAAEQDLKAAAAIAKFHRQPINKQLFPSQPAHAPTHSKYAQGKVPRTAVLKQSQDEIERASSTNSTRSSGSAAALPCTAISKVRENRVDKAKVLAKPAAVNGAHMGPDKILQNGHGVTSGEKSRSLKEDCTSADIISNVASFPSKSPTPSKNLHKDLLSCLRNATSQPVSTAKARLQSSELRRASLSKNVVTVKVTSPPRGNEPNPGTTDTTGTSSSRADEGPGLCSRQNGIPGSSKGTFARTRSQSLKVAQTNTKKSPILNQGLPKTIGSSVRLTKRVEHKVVNGVDKGKQKKSPKGPVAQTPATPVDTQALELVQYKTVCEEQKGIIQKLKQHLTCSNQRFEALTLVIQHVISQREETVRKRKELSQELLNLRGDLVSASSTCDKLEKEKNDLLVAYEGILQKVKDEHLAELADLEEKLKQFYTGECEKLQTIFIAEAEKYKNELQEKVDDLNTTHEAYRLAAETSQIASIEAVKEEYEKSISELRTSQEQENKSLQDAVREKQAELERKIQELTQENESLKEKLRAEEEQRKQSKEKVVQKSPHVMYLEQELESLKAVLEIKNEKLHQQDKKLMQIEKLVETNTTLVERLNKCQQENEDLKARMANHIAISRQLSTEQEVLQRSLEKESKVNKRLSMENEELLWKLHNGDLCSPKKLSPSSPGIPFHPARNSGSFSSPTVSPR